ncbi:hypothetical protein SAMN05216359_105119 [Roseateles sp. YR242]|uniref:hypothetical protein n=1 Tax=Roseateles sp. YR242 TaxID=1855305 RepID=UPI0008D4AF28|nr:hypothetical protein [Roseateles sp. YR242]SEL08746.1 hypothetical protein SAMN05216359_105119 [Roseateles sp. YR242]
MSIKHYTFWAVVGLAPVAAWTMLHSETPDPGAPLLFEPTAAGSSPASASAESASGTAGLERAGLDPTALPGASPDALPQWQALLAAELRQDPSAAWQHALQLASQRPGWAQALVQPLLEPLWQRREFALVLNGLENAPLTASLRDAWTTATVTKWSEFAPAQAASWAAHRGAGLAASGAGGAGGAGGSGGAGGAAASSVSGAGNTDLMALVNDRWAHQDPRSATVFASMLTTDTGRALLTESLSRWLAMDGSAARAWIRAQGVSVALDAAIAAHATQDELARQAPQEAIDLVHRIADPTRRNQAQWALARTLHDIDASGEQLIQQALQGAGSDPDRAATNPLSASDGRDDGRDAVPRP